MRYPISLFLLLVVPLLFMGCRGNDPNYIPEIKVNLEIDLYLPSYQDLNVITGSYIDSLHGYKGLIIYHATETDFYAYDQACPLEPFEDEALIEVEPWSSIGVCSKCGSRFILTDGFPIEGPAEKPLKTYQTNFTGRYIRIYN
ncbi:MAG: hypothetical protein CSA95_01565 [Bacteroidetes bacterium]|nr:MAG: hypothetical protein CSA95_01565 [Bacteroidota bacterium]